MSKEHEYIDLTGDTPFITKVDKQAIIQKHIDLSSDSSASLDFEWDIIKKRALKSQRNRSNIHLHLSDTDSFDSCDGFIEKGGTKPVDNLGNLGFNFRATKIPNNITINNYNNTINLLPGQDQTRLCIHPFDNTITISADSNQQAANSAAQFNNNYNPSTSDSSTTSTGTDEIYKPTADLQNPTMSYVRPIPTRASTKTSQKLQGDRNISNSQPSSVAIGKSKDKPIEIDSDSDARKLNKSDISNKRKEYWSDDSIEILTPESVQKSFFGKVPTRRTQKSCKRLNKGGLKNPNESKNSARIHTERSSSANFSETTNTDTRKTSETQDEQNIDEFFAEI